MFTEIFFTLSGLTLTQSNLAMFVMVIGSFVYGLGIPMLSIISPSVFLIAVWFLDNRRIHYIFLRNLTILFLFIFFYYVIIILNETVNDSYDILHNAIAGMAICLQYCIGYFIIKNCNSDKRIQYIIFSLAGGVIFAILSTYKALVINDVSILMTRKIISFWTEDELINSPAIGLYLSLGTCLIVGVFDNIAIKVKFFLILLFISSLYLNIAILNRTPLYAAIIVIFMVEIIYFLTAHAKQKVTFIINSILLTIILFLLFKFYVEDLSNNILISEFMKRIIGEGLDSPRYLLWSLSLQQMFQSPFGSPNMYLMDASYSHNFWLDVGRYAGFIPMVTILVFHLYHIKYAIKVFFCSSRRCFTLIGLTISFFIGFFVEPVMIASPTYFGLCAFVLGSFVSLFELPNDNKTAKHT